MKTVTALQAGLATALVLAAIAAAADPMRPLAQPVKAGAGSDAATAPRAAPAVPAIGRLVAIREDSRGQRQALIGERWLSVGDRLEQNQVLAIGPNQVDLLSGKQRSTLHLLPPLQAGSPTITPPTTLADAARGSGTRAAVRTTP